MQSVRVVNYNFHRGFTLIELLVVIAIIGVLSTIVLVSINSARDKARVASAKATVRQVGSAVYLYSNTNGPCPFPAHCYDGSCDPIPSLNTAMGTKLPAADPWGLAWRYHCHPNGGYSGECTCFFSSGPNKTIEQWPWSSCSFAGDDIGWCQGQPADLGY